MNKWAADLASTEDGGCPGQSHVYLITIVHKLLLTANPRLYLTHYPKLGNDSSGSDL